ncbi:MAG TPA: glycosyltransferase family A protein [Candidatus Limnocylindrales bacterium]|nr:glycosyltransferase family A protein [Candidatus Limnocylindrales bacterium]
MANPKATILIDTYNHERLIEEAIGSVLEQDFPAAEMEVLVVDDGSSDRTPEIVRKFEPRVRLIRKSNGGQASAFNAGIPEAHGEIVAFLDGDDWWAHKKLKRVVETLDSDPAVGIVGHGIVMVEQDGRQQTETLREGFRFQANTIEGARLLRVRGSFLGTSRMTIRAELLRRIGRVPEALVVQADEYLSTMAAALAGVQILPEALTYYRLHGANLFQITDGDWGKARRKQKVLAELAQSLHDQLLERGIEPRVESAITRRLQAEADQLRLMMDGGWPWETVRTERYLYKLLHPDAAWPQRAFKALALLPALVLPPKIYYSARQQVAASEAYRVARGRWLPVPGMSHLQRETQSEERSTRRCEAKVVPRVGAGH